MLITNLQAKLIPAGKYKALPAVSPSVLVREPQTGQRGRWVWCRVDVGRRDQYLGGRGWVNARTLYHVRYGLDVFRWQSMSVAEEMQQDPLYIAWASTIIGSIWEAVRTQSYAPNDRWE